MQGSAPLSTTRVSWQTSSLTKTFPSGTDSGEDGNKCPRVENVVSPDVVIDAYGADSTPFEMFLGPLEAVKP